MMNQHIVERIRSREKGSTTPKVGNRIYLQYGCMHGDAFATVTSVINDRWGTRWAIKLDDGTNDEISSVVATVTMHNGVVSGTTEIGAYLVRT